MSSTAAASAKDSKARPTGRGRPSRQQSAAITDAIIQTATALFLKEGFDGTSMEAVAHATQIPKTTLYKRYPDKLALLNAVLVARVASWSEVTSRDNARLGNDLRQRLIQHTSTMLLWTTKPEVRAFRRLALNAFGRSEGSITDFFGYTEMVAYLVAEIRVYGPPSGIEAKAPERIAQAIMAMVIGWVNTRAATGPVTAADARAQAQFIIDVLIDGHARW
ncbi:TetR/AcrR family transcriptional regulator [Novosphingobium aerophilum]|uniref:TetR/AcrR family transcriptional regulator n=1 Tax=Novosphingobium TaxID=165696 RepID=UPI0006C84E20|nr:MULTISPECIES: TetR/AcrR family transcriptional regulator [unclassified Novosphingobium]MPS69783.1 TetR/AcrR family transcriptional regulator [Novosphingobium sp.]TCM36054.1 TetR family transcriptional regulator [Novosphingobium sp. ST904]WRT95041.1 TetR/AcrR family transcriptional regulator [Novosphingobium sp. RL4]